MNDAIAKSTDIITILLHKNEQINQAYRILDGLRYQLKDETVIRLDDLEELKENILEALNLLEEV